jgi:F-type H+-transporting ATPase subunit b
MIELFASVGSGGAGGAVGPLFAETTSEGAGLTINLFWILVSAVNFLVFLALVYLFALKPVSKMLRDRRERLETGLRDAEQARRDRDQAEADRLAALTEARREANEILSRAQRLAQESREGDMAATRAELERLRVRATEEIEAEKNRAMSDLRAEVASLAIEAAGKVVGESMDDPRQRRLVEEFLRETSAPSGGSRS